MSSIMNRSQLLQAINQAFRESSTEAIMLHQAVADILGLNITDHKCMDFIDRYGPMPAGKLAELTGLTTGAITGVIDRLEKAGYAKRVRDPKDRRQISVELTPNKELTKKLEEVFQPLADGMSKITASYSDKELELFLDFITKIVKASHEETLRLRKKD